MKVANSLEELGKLPELAIYVHLLKMGLIEPIGILVIIGAWPLKDLYARFPNDLAL